MGEATDTDVIIPDYYEGYPVKYIGEKAFENTAITSVKFGNNIYIVETAAFKDCTQLKSVDIDAECSIFFYSCFKNCTSLRRIELPSSTYSINANMFEGCTSLEYVDLGGARVLPSDYFNGCSSLTTLVANSLSAFTGYDTMFKGCTNLSAFNIPQRVERVSASWFQDTKLVSVSGNIKYVGNWAVGFDDAEQATSSLSFRSGTIGVDAFSFESDKVTDVFIPATLTRIYGTFANLKNIEIIHLADLEAYLRLGIGAYGLVSSLQSDSYRMYLNGSELTDLVIPESITEIPEGAFYNCQSIQTVRIHSGVTKIGKNAFTYCKKIVSTEYKNGKYIGETGGAMVLIGLVDKTATAFEFAPNTVMISESAFASSKIESITVPESVKVIGSSAFSDCTSLTSVKLASGLTEIAELTFSGCTSLSDITVPDGVTVVRGGAFYRCTALTKLPFGANSKLETIDDAYVVNTYNKLGTFASSGLEQITFPATLTYIGDYAFKNCSKFNELTIGSSVIYIGHYSFENCKMTKLVVDGTDKTQICSYAFSSCSALESADIKAYFINTSAFGSCRSLHDLTLREGLKTMGFSVFSFNTSLYTVTLPSTLTSIEKNVFNYCDKLVEIQNLSAVSITKEEVPSLRLLRSAATPSAISEKDGFVFFRDDADGKTYLLLYIGKETEVTLPVISGGYELFEGAFSGSAFTKVTVPQGAVTAIGDSAFMNSKSLEEIHISADVTSISDSAFRNCESLTTIEIDENNAVYSAKNGIIYNSEATEVIWASSALSGRIELPDTVAVIGKAAFEDCYEMTEIFMTGATQIEASAFSWCDGLESITLSNSLKSIGTGAFSSCIGLETIIFEGSMEEWIAVKKARLWDNDTGEYTVVCTDGTLDKNGSEITEQ